MRNIVLCAAVVALSFPALGQSSKDAEVFSSANVTMQFSGLAADAKAKGSGGATLGDYGSHAIKLTLRTKSGGAEIHEHFDDIFFVTGGRATLLTGGTVQNSKTKDGGETQGTAIEGGQTQTVAKGDVVHVPAGTPHQFILAPGEQFSAVVVKVKE